MKIINRPTEKNWWVGGRVRCISCGSTLELEKKDKVLQAYGGGVWITCPVCKFSGNSLTVTEKEKQNQEGVSGW